MAGSGGVGRTALRTGRFACTIVRMFDTYLRLWDLVPDGGPILTASGGVLPVVWHMRPAMLKVATCDEERRGNALMTWWNGDGAARVWLHDSDAVLLERAQPAPTLAGLSAAGHDDDAIRIACAAVARLHAHRAPAPPAVVPLHDWFYALLSHDTDDDVLRRSAATAHRLLAVQSTDEVVLHGDIHHGNVLHFGDRGWLAIDPKGLRGDRAFDYANLPCWMVFDQGFIERYGFPITGGKPGVAPPQWVPSAATLAGLAERLAIPAYALEATVKRWNAQVAAGRDDDFHRGEAAHDQWWGDAALRGGVQASLGPIDRGPFYAVEIKSGALGTKGGPKTNVNANVLNVDGEPIGGLYAAGNVMSSPMGMTYGGAGGTIAPGMVFGYLAGRHAAGNPLFADEAAR